MGHTVLQFDWEAVEGQLLIRALGENPTRMDDGTICYDAVSILLENSQIRITVVEDTDELLVSAVHDSNTISDRPLSEIPIFGKYAGKELGWCWIGTNYRGYKDTFTLSFDNLTPQILLIGEGSQIDIRTITA